MAQKPSKHTVIAGSKVQWTDRAFNAWKALAATDAKLANTIARACEERATKRRDEIVHDFGPTHNVPPQVSLIDWNRVYDDTIWKK